ncbi:MULTISPECIES: zinc-binding alcohol dehydrogenase [unclassified Wenzhouxiangella]|uniref:zinc-dependent alcohol dehydrogenase n=1 Tax=unclassified Wenzhouxiangella TaxID=2613841 RepID=UPI000E32693D|nr:MULTISPECIES: zinc-binding alcohol dehydrogenase [unclassified Wenzhouxiangella]RFF27500.1 dehydrogenase [Wenzhouxiangella sp. 15181]RFP69638.1 dehydrogenase [Wenzhouxiangella sp. 15190]
MSGTARAFWIVAPGRGEIRSESLPDVAGDRVLVRTVFSGISRGTEALVFNGQVPSSEYERMRAPFQQGDFPGPVKYGYSAVGVVEDGPEVWRGRAVFCLHPHQERFVVPAESVVSLPEDVPATRAVLAANMETAVNAVWDAGIGPGDRVAVVGAGVIGSLVAWLAGRIPGTDVTLIDLQTRRERLAERLGVGFAAPGQAEGDCDVVVHASGSESGLASALALAGNQARVVEMSWYGTTRPAVPLGEAFHSRRLSLISSQVGQLPPERQPRWTYRRRLELALRLLTDPALDHLISGASSFENLAEDMPGLLGHSGDVLCHRIEYGHEK